MRVVFWDFDGTLARRAGSWPEILREAVFTVDPRIDVDVDDLASGMPRGFPDWERGELRAYPSAAAWWAAASATLLRACACARIDPAVAERAIAEVPQLYYRPNAWSLLPGALDALALTSTAGCANAILSNHAPELPELVNALGLGTLIERTITSASLGAEKPDPAVFRTALALTRAAPDSWMIGDNPDTDVAGARAVGMRAVLVHRRQNDEAPLTLLDAAARVMHEDTDDPGPGFARRGRTSFRRPS